MQDVAINGRLLQPPVATLVVRGRVLVPARAVFHGLGAAVDFDPESGRIAVRRGLHFLQVTIGSRQGYVDNRPVTLDVAPLTHDGIIYMPMRFVAEPGGPRGARAGYGGHRRFTGTREFARAALPARVRRREKRRPAAFDRVPAAPRRIRHRRLSRRSRRSFARTAARPTFRPFASSSTAPTSAAASSPRTTPSRTHPRLRWNRARITSSCARSIRPATRSSRVGRSAACRFRRARRPASWVCKARVRGARLRGFRAGRLAALHVDHDVRGGRLRDALRLFDAVSVARGNDAYHYYVSITPAVGFFAPACQAVAFFTDINGYQNAYPLSVPLAIDTRPRTKP